MAPWLGTTDIKLGLISGKVGFIFVAETEWHKIMTADALHPLFQGFSQVHNIKKQIWSFWVDLLQMRLKHVFSNTRQLTFN